MLRLIGSVTALALLLVGCGGGGGSDSGGGDSGGDGGGGGGGVLPPTALTYASPVTATVGEPLTPLVPALSGHADAFISLPRFRLA